MPSQTTTNYTFRTETEPHQARRNAILKKYPEARKLFGHNPVSGIWLIGIFAVQIFLAATAYTNFGWLGIVVAALTVGAVTNHALFVLIHEAAHNLIFKSTLANRWAGIFANFTQGIPSAMAFRTYHLSHHKYQGIMELDADLPGPTEAKLIGANPVSKGLWLFSFLIIQGFVRPARLTQVNLWNGWVVTNLIAQIAFNVAVVVLLGWPALAYLLISTWFAVGLHPLGARWVQEHFVFREGQETYSYYGPFNKLMFNVGYHNEHHDLMTVPWNHLPTLRKMAPEFYDSLYYHQSYWKLLYQFLMDPKINAFSRVVQTMPHQQPLPTDAAYSKTNTADSTA
jgi:sphingolipid 4-desaturase/C4-monooxygenase